LARRIEVGYRRDCARLTLALGLSAGIAGIASRSKICCAIAQKPRDLDDPLPLAKCRIFPFLPRLNALLNQPKPSLNSIPSLESNELPAYGNPKSAIDVMNYGDPPSTIKSAALPSL